MEETRDHYQSQEGEWRGCRQVPDGIILLLASAPGQLLELLTHPSTKGFFWKGGLKLIILRSWCWKARCTEPTMWYFRDHIWNLILFPWPYLRSIFVSVTIFEIHFCFRNHVLDPFFPSVTTFWTPFFLPYPSFWTPYLLPWPFLKHTLLPRFLQKWF